MIIYKFVYFIFLFISVSVYAQSPQIQWQKSIGADGDDISNSIVNTSDGGYICGGISNSNLPLIGAHGDFDISVIKLDSLGNVQWQKLYGGSGYDYLFDIKQTFDGGFIFCGYTRSYNGDVSFNHGNGHLDCWVVKLDSIGTILWEKSYGGTELDEAVSIIQLNDSGYVFAGVSRSNDGDVSGPHGDSDGWVVKLDPSGNIQWERPFGGSRGDEIHSIVQCADKGFLFAGSSSSDDYDLTLNQGSNDFWIVKLDSIGFIQWVKSYGGSGSDFATSLIKTHEEEFIVEGGSYSHNGEVTGNHGDMDIWVVKLDSTGNILWEKSLGGTDLDYPGRAQIASNGYVIGSYAYSNDGDVVDNYGGYGDCWIVQLDTSGNIMYEKNFGGSREDRLNGLQLTRDGGVIFAGWSDSFDHDLTNNEGNFDSWIVKLNSLPIKIDENEKSEFDLEIYPNPSHSYCKIKSSKFSNSSLDVFDIMGRKVISELFDKELILNLNSLSPGIYVLEMTDLDEFSIKRRILKY